MNKTRKKPTLVEKQQCNANNPTKVSETSERQVPVDETDFVGNYLDSNEIVSDLPKTKSVPVQSILADIKKSDHETLNKMLLEILSPELSNNEMQKRYFKEKLVKYIIRILTVQLIFFLIITLCFMLACCFKMPFIQEISLEQISAITNFLKYYISAIIVEFISMLFFIVKFVFDKSIVSLITQLFKKND